MRTTLFFAIVACGCVNQPSESDGEQELISITAVHLATQDTPEKVETVQVTVDEWTAMFFPEHTPHTPGVLEQAIQQINPCQPGDLTLHDLSKSACQLNPGACHTICFFGVGTATLSSYCRIWNPLCHCCSATWDKAVASYDPQGRYGYFEGLCNGLDVCLDYNNLEGWTDMGNGTCDRSYDWVTIGSFCP